MMMDTKDLQILQRLYEKRLETNASLREVELDLRRTLFAAQTFLWKEEHDHHEVQLWPPQQDRLYQHRYTDEWQGMHEWYTAKGRHDSLTLPRHLIKEEGEEHPARQSSFKRHSSFKKEVQRLRDIKLRFETVNEALQRKIDELWGPFSSGVQLLDMPDELLISIFEFCSERDIRSCRLVCRRFCDLSSPMLLARVTVILQVDSLARLEEISHHPTISKGVRTVRIGLHFYHGPLCQDINHFVQFYANKLERLAEESRRDRHNNEHRDKMAEAIAASWRRFLDGSPAEQSGDSFHHEALRAMYCEYRKRYEQQELLKTSGRFVQAVASAMARMPRARDLDFGDDFTLESTIGHDDIFDEGGDPYMAYHWMLLPLKAEQARKDQIDTPLFDIIHHGLAAMGSARVQPESVGICLYYVTDLDLLVPPLGTREHIRLATRCMKRFAFTHVHYFFQREAYAVSELLKACLGAPLLERLQLTMPGNRVVGGDSMGHMGQVITSHKWPKLTSTHLSGVGINLVDLSYLLKNLPPEPDSLCLQYVHLAQGTWEMVLDELRNAGFSHANVVDPSGAEVDWLGPREYWETFSSTDYDQRGKAWEYMRREKWTTSNPLRDLRDPGDVNFL
ncbi:hypothetical protein QBC44DRAFT_134177 [Cladorrhinum sp. PSN332]|nr:hypothetical protein QBC44DRAFT_134177 [Cladorrhinum sp. PSN332]